MKSMLHLKIIMYLRSTFFPKLVSGSFTLVLCNHVRGAGVQAVCCGFSHRLLWMKACPVSPLPAHSQAAPPSILICTSWGCPGTKHYATQHFENKFNRNDFGIVLFLTLMHMDLPTCSPCSRKHSRLNVSENLALT